MSIDAQVLSHIKDLIEETLLDAQFYLARANTDFNPCLLNHKDIGSAHFFYEF